MENVFYRMPRQSYPSANGGDGAYIFDSAGKRYLDASGGAAVSCLGQSDQRVVAPIKCQLDKLPFAHSAFFTTPLAEELAEFLGKAAPGDLNHVYFVSGGPKPLNRR
jgi:adenosylmethionine-8-amino-7-oxononanoate aminotransferase